jgi:hypothetical protein
LYVQFISTMRATGPVRRLLLTILREKSKQSVRPRQDSCNICTAKGSYPPGKTPSWRTTFFRLSVAANSTHSQVDSTVGGRHLHPQPEGVPCRCDRRHT